MTNDDLKGFDVEKLQVPLSIKSAKHIMNRIESLIVDLDKELSAKKESYVLVEELGGEKRERTVDRAGYLEFIIHWAQGELESLSGEIFEETGVNADVE
jgi:hypothetical protein